MSKKQVKTKKNVFGLVSKIGSLIKKGGNSASNIENVETARSSGTSGSETPRKNFNIQISDDNQEIFAVGDEEEEEEEDEEENEKETKDKKEIENKDNNNENISNDKDNKNNKEVKDEKVNPDIKKETKENKNKNEDISVKEEEKEKQNIKNNNLNDSNNINNIKDETKIVKDTKIDDKEAKNNIDNSSNSKIIDENNKKGNNENINEIKEENNIINDNNKINKEENSENSINENFETCHLCLKKGNDFNSDEIYCIPIIRNKKKKSVLQKFGLFKKAKYDLVNYKIFFDECFLYLSKDIVIDKKNANKRRINNVLKIKNIINFNTKKEQNNYFVTIDIYNKNGILKNKEFFIEEKYFDYFNKEINKSLELYGGLYMKSKKL